MTQAKKSWFSTEDTTLTKKRLTAEIRRISNEKMPVAEKMCEVRQLIEQYFKIYANEEMLNANL